MRHIVIGFNGKKHSGKSLASKILRNELENNFLIFNFSFAEPLKRIISDIFILEKECYENKEDIIEKLGVSARDLMQKIGTDLFRDKIYDVLPNLKMKYKSIWVNHMYETITKCIIPTCINNNIIILIDDCRFEDEYKMIKDLNGFVIGIKRESISIIDNHKSEKNDVYDYQINKSI